MPEPAFVKRSFSWAGKTKCIAMEGAFWSALADIAAERDVTLKALIREVLDGRDNAVPSTLRVYVLDHVRAAARVGVQDAL